MRRVIKKAIQAMPPIYRIYQKIRAVQALWDIADMSIPPVHQGSQQRAMLHTMGDTPLPGLHDVVGRLVDKQALVARNIPMSAFVVTYNEKSVLELSLLSLAAFQELIVIDKGSTDGSMAIAETYATKIIQAPWSPVVEDTRAMADQACTQEWRIFLDADEFLTPKAVEFIRDCLQKDAAGQFPYDAIGFPRVNHLFAEEAQHNLYKPTPLVRMYRSGFYQHERVTHKVALKEGARVYHVDPHRGMDIIHFNQDTLYEYLEKMNRYTETYTTTYPTPKTGKEIYDFALQRMIAARRQGLAQSLSAYDAVCDLVTAIYYTVEYLKQWEQDRGRSVDAHYAEVVKRLFHV